MLGLPQTSSQLLFLILSSHMSVPFPFPFEYMERGLLIVVIGVLSTGATIVAEKGFPCLITEQGLEFSLVS